MLCPLVSVIIAAYNCEEYIEECVNSILNQTYQNIEILICDDNSDDNTWRILKDLESSNPNIYLMRNQQNKKAAFSRNRCIEKSRGKYIAVQDADDLSHPERIEKQVEILERFKSIDFVSSGMKLFDVQGVWKITKPNVKFPNKKDFLKKVPFAHAPTMFRREPLLTVEGYRVSKETVRGQDADLFMRLYYAGYKGMNIENPLYFYRVDGRTLARRSLKYRYYATVVNLKNFKKLELMPLGYLYALKPLISWFIPHGLIYKWRKISK